MASRELEDLKSRLQKLNNKPVTNPSTPSQPFVRDKKVQAKIPINPSQIKREEPVDDEEEEEIEEDFEEEMRKAREEERQEAQYQQTKDNEDELEDYEEEQYIQERMQIDEPVPMPVQKPKINQITGRPYPTSMESKLQRMKQEQQQTQYQQQPQMQRPMRPQRPIQQPIQIQEPKPQNPNPEDLEQFREQLASEIVRLRDHGAFAVELLFQFNRLNTNLEILIKSLTEE